MVNFPQSQTKDNLMRAFAGECQARSRYDIASSIAKKQKLHVVEHLFKFTANQELAHAKIYLDHLKEFDGTELLITASYPVVSTNDVIKLLKLAHQHEVHENEVVYSEFARTARSEGFESIAYSFEQIGKIEKIHACRFAKIATLMENESLFKATSKVKWICLHCGHVQEGESAPVACPVCSHPQGYFTQEDITP